MGGPVIVGMSGGVDSAVAALLLSQAGHEVQGLFMANWEEDEDGYCTAAEDFQDARRVCEEIGIPLHRVGFAAEYRDRVFAHFLAEYAAGRTPNPDVLCNREIKFGVCLEHARRLGAERFATGHYARVGTRGGRSTLLRAADEDKDQSYFLHAVGAAELADTLFPLGELTKPEVRRIARHHGLPVHDKKDSTGICFIGERPFRRFLENYLPAQPGPIETPEGRSLGQHAGLMFHTIGQRSGLGLGGQPGLEALPWYVAGKDVARNTLIVVQGHDHPALLSTAATARQVSWVGREAPGQAFDCLVQVRYRQRAEPCRVNLDDDGGARIDFARAQRAVTPGQYAVFYEGQECLGGGVIATSHAAATRGS